MNQPTTFEVIPLATLLERVRRMHAEHRRLVQIGAARLPEHLELNYSFDCAGHLVNLRLQLPAENPRVPSISSIYWCAFIYENEIHDLFKVQVDGMVIDFEGQFYQTAVKYPFGSPRVPQAKPVAAASVPRPAAKSEVAPAPEAPPAITVLSA